MPETIAATPVSESQVWLENTRTDEEEGYRWHALFREGFVTAHELAVLPLGATPEQEGELLRVETHNLRAIRAIIERDLSDADFREQLPVIRSFLPRPFEAMVGMEQTGPHWNIDPVDHTINALSELRTTQLTVEERALARIVLVFHDIGKVFDPADPAHPRRSAELVRDYIEKMHYSPDQQERIIQHIRWHDALGEIARRDGRNILNPADVATYFPNTTELALHATIVQADVSSIPGLKKYVEQVIAVHTLMEEQLRAQESYIEINFDQELPFEPVSFEEVDEVCNRLLENKKFDDIDIEDEIQERREAFNSLTPEDQELLVKGLIQSYFDTDRWDSSIFSFKILRTMGRETDRTLPRNLEMKYGVELTVLRLSIELFNLTYNLWDANQEVLREDFTDSYIQHVFYRRLKEILKSATFLSSYALPVTHITTDEAGYLIEESRVLLKSVDGITTNHHEGDGVYTGLLGSYLNWKNGPVFEFLLPLADTLPVIQNYNQPYALANALGEAIDIAIDKSGRAVVHGLKQWRKVEFGHDTVLPWKITMLEELLNAKATVMKDQEGLETVVMDTAAEPIVWAALCRALRIPRFIPQSELSKMELPYSSPAVEAFLQPVETTNDSESDLLEEQLTVPELRNIKGLRGIPKRVLQGLLGG